MTWTLKDVLHRLIDGRGPVDDQEAHEMHQAVEKDPSVNKDQGSSSGGKRS